jgi:hypothetical protein
MEAVAEASLRHRAASWPGRPEKYARYFLRQRIVPELAAVAERLAEPPYRLLIPSGHNLGKTHLLSCLIQHHHDSYDPGIVLATAPTSESLKKQLFKEIRSSRPFRLGLLPQAAEIQHTPRHFVLGLTTNNPEAFRGKHERHLLLVFDEATGIDVVFWEEGETMFQPQPGHGWVCAYNPYDPTTAAHTEEQSGRWAVCRLSALDHPNIAAELRGEPAPVPAAVRLNWIWDRIHAECADCGHSAADDTCFEFPPGSNRFYKPLGSKFEPGVLGRWPSRAFDSVWGEADLRRCRRSVTIDPDWPVQIGVDASRFGQDRTVFAVRKGTAVVHLEARTAGSWPTRRVSHHIADRLRELCHRYAPRGVPEKRVPCLVDDTGGYGSGVTDYPEGYSFYGVNSSETADRPDRYPNRRSEMIFTLRLAADEDALFWGSVQRGGELVRELEDDLRAIRTVPDRKSRQVAEGKPGIKARLRRSPDVADAVALAWYAPPGGA